MKSKLIIILAAVTLALSSCHTSRSVVDVPATGGNTPAANVPAVELTPKAQYQALAASYGDWTDVYMPVNLSLVSPSRVSISGRATMVRGKQIHMSLRMLGFEVATLYIDQDSVFATEKIHKYYIAESIGELLRGADLTLDDLQSMLLGQVFEPGKGVITKSAKGLDVSIDGDNMFIAPKRVPRGTEWLYACTVGDLPVLQTLDIDVADRADIDCSYSGHAMTECGLVARTIDVDATAADRTVSAQLRWDLGAARWNEGRTASFKKPTGYKRISGAALLKSLSSL